MQTIHAVFQTRDEAAHAIRALKTEAGLSARELTVVARDDDLKLTKREQGAVGRAELQGGAWSGTLLGAAAGGAAGVILSSFAILPALPLLMAGGAALGALASGGVSRDIIDEQVKQANEVLRAGGAMVFIHSDSSALLARAAELLRAAHAASVSSPVEDARPVTT